MHIDVSNMINILDLKSSEQKNVEEIMTLAKEADSFLASQEWCKRVVNGSFDRGWGYIVCVFYFTIEPAFEGVPEHIWIVVGDIPPAYIDAEDNPNGACALDAYVMEMQQWVDHVMQNKSVSELIPVNVPPNKKYAKMLQQRLNVIKTEILACYQDEISKGLATIESSGC